MVKPGNIRITIKGAGLSYAKNIDQDVAGQIMALCLSSQDIGADSIKRRLTTLGSRPGSQRESAAEYLNRHAPKRNPDKILALAGFLRAAHNKDSFQPSEIKGLFRDAGELTPANFRRDFKWVVSSGWIAEDQAKRGIYYITNTGLKVLEGGFPAELVKKSRYKVGTRRKKSKASE